MKKVIFILIALVVLVMGCQQKQVNLNKQSNLNNTTNVIEKVLNKYKKINSFKADVTVNIIVGNRKSNLNYVYAFEKPDKEYIRDLNTGNIAVVNGTYKIIYLKNMNTIQIIKFYNKSKIKKMFFRKILSDLSSCEVNYIGNQTIDNTKCYVLEVNTKNTPPYKLWVNSKLLPVKVEYTAQTKLIPNVRLIVYYKNISINNVNDSVFNFTIPKNVNISKSYICDNFSQAENHISFRPFIPKYTDGLNLYEVSVTTNGYQTLQAIYKNNTNYIYITETNKNSTPPIGIKTVNVNGTKVYLGMHYCSFIKNGIHVLLLSNINTSDMLKIVKSMI